MADLLECVIQIKGVADTPRRLALRLAAVSCDPGRAGVVSVGLDVLVALTTAELRFRECLELMLARDRPSLPAVAWTAGAAADGSSMTEWEERFARERRTTVGLLDLCTAEDLNRVGLDPSRGPMTVADLVAQMLAHDTDQVGRLVEAIDPPRRIVEDRA